MMHIEYKKTDYKGCRIHIQPDHESDIPMLRELVTNKLNIKNPVKTFREKMKSGQFDGIPEEKVAAEAEIANILSDLWDNEYSMNVMMLLSRAMQEIINLKSTGPK